MNTQTALNVCNAIETLGKVLNMTPGAIVSRIIFFDKEKREILLEAQTKWVKFYKADIVERGAMLGIKIYDNINDKGEKCYESSVVLSERRG